MSDSELQRALNRLTFAVCVFIVVALVLIGVVLGRTIP